MEIRLSDSPLTFGHAPWVDFAASHVVCTCSSDTPGLGNISVKEPFKCTHCGKYARWTLRKCADCKKDFLKNFLHPLECASKQQCWECLTQKQGDPCTCSAEGIVMPRTGERVIPARSYVPPKYILELRKAVALDVAMSYEFDTDF